MPPGTMPAASLELLQRLVKIRDTANALLGAGGEPVVQKHVVAARLAIERGAGIEAVETAIQQIASAAATNRARASATMAASAFSVMPG